MAKIQAGDIQKAALIAGRSERTIRRWATQGVNIRNESKLKAFAAGAEKRSFGRYGGSGRLMGKRGGSRTSDAKRQSSKQNGGRGGRPKDGIKLLGRVVDPDIRALNLRNTPNPDFMAIWVALLKLDARLPFLIGDALLEIEKRSGEKSLRLAINQSRNPRELRESLELSRAIPPGSRIV
jgi:hypothetical protein